jgi:SAM-dependent methyltransferase
MSVLHLKCECPHCKVNIEFPSELSGQEHKCPECGLLVRPLTSIETSPSSPAICKRSKGAGRTRGKLESPHSSGLEWDAADYLAAHGDAVAEREHLETVRAYEPYVQSPALDWGCCAARDATLLARAGYTVRACDVLPTCPAKVPYDQLTHPYLLPCADREFGSVIGSGVIEHVPFPSRSLEEIWRVLVPGGTLILTYIPQQWSAVEFVLRRAGIPHHVRRFTRRTIKRLLVNHGFDVVMCRLHAPTPILTSFRNRLTLAAREWAPVWCWKFIPPLAQNLMVVARKVNAV